MLVLKLRGDLPTALIACVILIPPYSTKKYMYLLNTLMKTPPWGEEKKKVNKPSKPFLPSLKLSGNAFDAAFLIE